MEGPWPIASTWLTEQAKLPLEAAIAWLAERQHGVVSLPQLRALGLSASAVRMRVQRGLLHPVHRSVYAVGHSRLTVEGRWMAAVLACGAGAVLSHRAAAALWGLRESVPAEIDVTSASRAGRSRRGIRAHSGATLARRDVTAVDGIPLTSVARTLLDIAELETPRRLERICERAETLRVLDVRAIEDVLARGERRAGAAALRSAIAAWQPELALTRRELERRFLELCREANLPIPEVNVWIPLPGGGVEVDFLWRDARLVVETDSHRFHGTRPAFERDRRRDQRLSVAGFVVLRFTWRQVLDEPSEVARTIRALASRSDDRRQRSRPAAA